MATIGICEDQPAIRRALARGLQQAGHTVLAAFNGAEAIKLFHANSGVDAIVMDIGLPDSDGRDVVQALKAAGQDAPVLFLTALGATHEKLQGFAVGAEDYVVKPFEIKEVIARLTVLINRASRREKEESGLVLDPLRHTVRTADGEVALTPTEYRLLAVVLSRPDEVVRRQAVVAAAWPDGAIVAENTLDSFIRRIRVKLESINSPAALTTVRGVGFTIS
ncbi:response regulator transcription factor [Nocardioides sp. BP30]|uniref:response regulator transcription factor n=1 Tax=Nocardioides sp. BP30 TaxID=3036374 RepID=UPI0024683C83|nr:response regulator transcription factor [Nocardioides sp. BP30]WGL52497.1 response regulator transcription factor [Nocardioides sp. BP30]